MGTPVGSPGGDQSKQKQAHPAVTESIVNDGPTPTQQGFHRHIFQKPPSRRDLVRIIIKSSQNCLHRFNRVFATGSPLTGDILHSSRGTSASPGHFACSMSGAIM